MESGGGGREDARLPYSSILADQYTLTQLKVSWSRNMKLKIYEILLGKFMLLLDLSAVQVLHI